MFDKATGVAVIQGHRLLFGLRTDGQGWSLAGGKLEDGESKEECAKRELFEEFGITAHSLTYIGQVSATAYIKGKNQKVKPHIFACASFSGDVDINPKEMKSFRWFSMEDIETMENVFPPSAAAIPLIKKYLDRSCCSL
ncbi:NUDIX domain-containing protein [Clostridiaceae bacterium 35-E11]